MLAVPSNVWLAVGLALSCSPHSREEHLSHTFCLIICDLAHLPPSADPGGKRDENESLLGLDPPEGSRALREEGLG